MSSNGSTGPPAPPPMPDPATVPHDSLQPNIIASSLLTWLVATAFVGMRFFTRTHITRTRLSSSDWVILASLVFSLAVSILQILEVENGMGAHIWDLTPSTLNFSMIAELQWISLIFYAGSLALSKISILLLFIMIFYHTWVRQASYVVLGIVVLSSVWIYYVIFTACIPLQAFWDLTITNARCHAQTYWLSMQYLLIATDFLVFLLPLPVISKLNVRMRQKILLLFLFALGFFVCFISILRISLLADQLASPGFDAPYDSAVVFYWTSVELNAAIVVACGMTLRPLIHRFVPKMLSSHPYRESTSAHHSPKNAVATFGSGEPRRQVPDFGIQVESEFTARIDEAKRDEELGLKMESFDVQGRRLQGLDPYRPVASPAESESSEKAIRSSRCI